MHISCMGIVLHKSELYTEILEVNLFAFAYTLFHEDFSRLNGTLGLCECKSEL